MAGESSLKGLLPAHPFHGPARFGCDLGWLTINGAVGSPETASSTLSVRRERQHVIEVAGKLEPRPHHLRNDHAPIPSALDDRSFLNHGLPFSHLHRSVRVAPRQRRHTIRWSRCSRVFLLGTQQSGIIDFGGQSRPQPADYTILQQRVHQRVTTIFSTWTEQHINQGNIFLHVHRNGAPDSSAAIQAVSLISDPERAECGPGEITIVG